MKKVGDYVLLSELGKGQFGTVYKAKNCNTGDIFAIKTVLKTSVNSNTKLRTLFNTEISIMSRIKHPNVLRLYEYLETSNNYYLVIDYCNNGDMESYVKKHQFLGENEAVYFLMQIMNGFKDLHKHKIMHRDFKLANIFLNDDKLVIGDFGFAKSGVEMANTKLGSPITMAPELLLSQGGKLTYTNKTDLWSIGICFYQMIFGTLPWDVNDMYELKLMVKTRSGKNLPFPQDKPISPECREMLVRLLEQDPTQRIEWEDLFKHRLFTLHSKSKGEDMRQSIMFRNNEEVVRQMFDQNTKENIREVELAIEPERLNIEAIAQPGVESSQQMALNRLKARVISRYTHEKKTIVFFMYTCRRFRDLANEINIFKNAANNLMYAATLLLKKGIIMNEAAVMSLKTGSNIYGVEGFEKFAELEDRGRLREELEVKDTQLYQKLFGHLKERVKEEVEATDPRRDKILQLIADPACSIAAVDAELRRECSFLIPHFAKPPASLSEQARFELLLTLAHAYVAAYQNEYLGYLKDGVPFDWNEFEKSWNGKPGAEKIQGVLLRAMGG